MRRTLCLISFILLASVALADVEILNNTVSETLTPTKKAPKLSVLSAFAQSFSSIVVSELGDKTFFIAAIMSMRYSRIAVLLGALLALLLMTIISTAFGSIVPVLLPAHVTHIIITVLFFFFGAKLLYDVYADKPDEHDEQAEVEQELNQAHAKLMKTNKSPRKEDKIEYITHENSTNNGEEVVAIEVGDIEATNDTQTSAKKGSSVNCDTISTKLVFWQALTMTFLGEWGDRSQIATIALAAEGNPFVVSIGSFLGHVLCTSLAVIGGKFLAKRISEKTVNICGGILFLIFGIHNLLSHE